LKPGTKPICGFNGKYFDLKKLLALAHPIFDQVSILLTLGVDFMNQFETKFKEQNLF
jgi:hypothetical protein